MSIASSPNAFAAMTICDLVNNSSCLEGVLMMEVSAQSAIIKGVYSRSLKIYQSTHSLLQQTILTDILDAQIFVE